MTPEAALADGLRPETFTLYLDNSKPIRAEQLSSVLSVLTKEFRRQSKGGELIVAEVQTGSLKLKFAAAASALTLMTHTNTILDFAERVGQGIELAQNHPEKISGRRVGDKSALEILRLAAASGSDFRIDYSAPDGERLVVEMTATEAERTIERSASAEVSRKALPSQRRALQAPDDLWMDNLVADLAARQGKGLTPEERALIVIAVEVLRRHGSSAAIEDFARRLEAHGLQEEAQIVRKQGQRPLPRGLAGPAHN